MTPQVSREEHEALAREEPPPATPLPSRILWIGAAVGALGAALWLARWLAQGESAMWTDVARRFWVRDPALGWVETSERWVWLGLEGLLASVAVALGATLFVWLARRVRPTTPRVLAAVLTIGARVGVVAALATPALPLWALASGLPPEGAMRLVPTSDQPSPAPDPRSAAPPPLAVPAGAWHVVDDPRANLLAVRTAAGSDTFDTTFGPLEGTATFDPTNPGATRARISVAASSLTTGIELRDTHARKFIQATAHPVIAVTLDALDTPLGAGDSPNERRWSGRVTLSLMGADLARTAHGTITAIAAGAGDTTRTVLGDATLLVQGSFELPVSATRLDPKDFDEDRLVVTVRFVLAATR